jgi:hypothetical protein
MLMKTRSLFLTIALGLIVAGIGALDARAGSITLPTALDPGLTTTTLVTPTLIVATSNGNTTTVSGLTFSNFNYTGTGTGTASPYPATSIGVLSFSNGPNSGIELAAGFSVGAGGVQDMALTYTVTAAPGTTITDADLVMSGITTGDGTATVSETLTNAATGALIGSLGVSAGGAQSQMINFAGVTSINVLKDIDLNGGVTGSASISIIGQGFSTGSVPEPTSMALLGIGMTGFLAFRRLFKRNSVA